MNTRIESDLDTIIAAALAQRIGNMAASVRAAQSEVEPYESHEPYDYRRPEHVLTARGMHRVSAPHRTLESAPVRRRPLWRRRWVWVTTGMALAIVVLGVIVDAVSASLGISPTTLIVMGAGAVVLCCLLSGRSGGRGKSFTFHGTGRMD